LQHVRSKKGISQEIINLTDSSADLTASVASGVKLRDAKRDDVLKGELDAIEALRKFKEMTGFQNESDFTTFNELQASRDQVLMALLSVITVSLTFVAQMVAQVDELTFILSGTRNCGAALVDLVGEMINYYKSRNPNVEIPDDPMAAIMAICKHSNPSSFAKFEYILDLFTPAMIESLLSKGLEDFISDNESLVEQIKKDETQLEEQQQAIQESIEEFESERESEEDKERKAILHDKIHQLREDKKNKKAQQSEARSFNRDISKNILQTAKLVHGVFDIINRNIINPLQKRSAEIFIMSCSDGFVPLFLAYSNNCLLLTNK